ncbi:hypothetical protein Pla163_01860 [Planctomycetes bacterium Pla163]|jgi:hypothetical protein|uniref:GP-PDE domain-containing protein n=1 Tax=Rohdeia mirabilis TaxID=2528008 RepID=A0A518CV34_9BACT|nr:hypothetical protein Pla163_01860 [Planctomycetes bacterium Pla163]
MAIDLMIMPLSRYFSGDYITPAMRQAWSVGASYKILTSEGARECPPDVPLGGLDATSKRHAALPELIESLRLLPFGIPDSLWDEASDVEPCFYRLELSSLEMLLEEAAEALVAKPSFLGRLVGKKAAPSHFLSAEMFLPVPFSEHFALGNTLTGSVHTAKRELESHTWSSGARPAYEHWIAALEDAIALNQPLVVDM